jgi:hypothetical protein
VSGSLPRHRFAGYAPTEVCGEEKGFGAGNACAEPYDRVVHYFDEDHPFVPGSRFSEECEWRLQRSVTVGPVCGAPVGAVVHRSCVAGSGPLDDTVRLEWRSSKAVRPPDEDAATRSSWESGSGVTTEGGGVTESNRDDTAQWSAAELDRLGEMVGRREERRGLLSEMTFGEVTQSSAQEVVDALRGSFAVLAGPWPVRKFYLTIGRSFGPDRKAFFACQRSLMMLGIAWRVEASGDWAIVTWGPYLDLYLSELYDALLRDYP